MKISVLGSGAWGSALACVLVRNGYEVYLWSPFEEEVNTLQNERRNERFLPGVHFPDELNITNDINCVTDSQIVVIATPSFAVKSTAELIRNIIHPSAVVVSVAKGIERDTYKIFPDVIAAVLRNHIVVLSGPSHAEEVARSIQTAIIAASRNEMAAKLVQRVFMNDTLRVYTTPDVIGVSVGGALKNIIAIAIGICDGMQLGDNAKAALMTRGLTEIARLGVAMGAQAETFAGLSGIGDLIVTCTSYHSRNRRAGILIGEGMAPNEAISKVGSVVEGYYAVLAAYTLSKRLLIDMPITSNIYEVLYNGKSVELASYDLMTREKKTETEETWMSHITWKE